MAVAGGRRGGRHHDPPGKGASRVAAGRELGVRVVGGRSGGEGIKYEDELVPLRSRPG